MAIVYTKDEFEAILEAQPLLAKAHEVLNRAGMVLTAHAFDYNGENRIKFTDEDVDGSVVAFGEDND